MTNNNTKNATNGKNVKNATFYNNYNHDIVKM